MCIEYCEIIVIIEMKNLLIIRTIKTENDENVYCVNGDGVCLVGFFKLSIVSGWFILKIIVLSIEANHTKLKL